MYHHGNLGAYAPGPAHRDMDGYIPEATDGPFDLAFDHGGTSLRNADGTLTEHGTWWVEDGFPEWRDAAVAATAEAQEALAAWQAQ